MLTRRNFLRNASGLLIAAPMVVKASSLMPIFVPKKEILITGEIGYIEGFRFVCEYTDHLGYRQQEIIPSCFAETQWTLSHEGEYRPFYVTVLSEHPNDRFLQELVGQDAMRTRVGRRSLG